MPDSGTLRGATKGDHVKPTSTNSPEHTPTTERDLPSPETRATGTPDADGIAPTRAHQVLLQRKMRQRALQRRAGAGGAESGDLHAIAQSGVAGGGGALPHADRIQASFGRHDVGHIQSHVGGPAEKAAGGIGAQAYATGDHVAFASAPDLHTAAHEAAHVIQQQGGVQLSGGVGEEGDAHEQHADAVADAVVSGRSAEALLDAHAGSGGSLQRSTAGVQRSIGNGQPAGTHIVDRLSKQKGVILRFVAKQGYEVRWADGSESTVKANDAMFDVAPAPPVHAPPPSTTPPSTTPPTTHGAPPSTTPPATTPPATHAAPPSTTPPATTPPATHGSGPSRSVSSSHAPPVVSAPPVVTPAPKTADELWTECADASKRSAAVSALKALPGMVAANIDQILAHDNGQTTRKIGAPSLEDGYGASAHAHIGSRHVLDGKPDIKDKSDLALRVLRHKPSACPGKAGAFAGNADATSGMQAAWDAKGWPYWRDKIARNDVGSLELDVAGPTPKGEILAGSKVTQKELPPYIDPAGQGGRPLYPNEPGFLAHMLPYKTGKAGEHEHITAAVPDKKNKKGDVVKAGSPEVRKKIVVDEKNPLTTDVGVSGVHLRVVASPTTAGGWFIHSAWPY